LTRKREQKQEGVFLSIGTVLMLRSFSNVHSYSTTALINMYTLSKRAMPGFASQFTTMHRAISKIRLALMVDDLVAWVLQME